MQTRDAAISQGKTIATGADIGRMAVEVGMLMPETPTVYVVLPITIAILVPAVRVVHPIHKIMRLISSRALMGDALNGRAVNVISGVTTVAILGASADLIATRLPQSG